MNFEISNYGVTETILIVDDDEYVRGLTSEGINSRWGEAKRSKKDKSCWIGEDFKICAK